MLDFMQGTFTGRLVRDPEQRMAPNGTTILLFSVAVNLRRYDGTERTEFVECVAFGKLAEALRGHARKGTSLLLVCEWETREWSDRQGAQRKKTEFTVKDFRFLGDKQTPNQTAETTAEPNYASEESTAPNFQDVTDEDLPF